MDTKPTSKLPGSTPKNFALVCSLLLHVGLITLVSYLQWDSKVPEQSPPKVLKVKFISPAKSQESSQNLAPAKAEYFPAVRHRPASSSPIPTLHARIPDLSAPAHQLELRNKIVKPSLNKHYKSRMIRRRSLSVFKTKLLPARPFKAIQQNHDAVQKIAIKPAPTQRTLKTKSAQAMIPVKIGTTGQLKVAQRRIPISQTGLSNMPPIAPQPKFSMTASRPVPGNLHRRPVPATTFLEAEPTIQRVAEAFTVSSKSRTQTAALPRKMPENISTALDVSGTSDVDTNAARGLFTGKVRQRIADAKYYPRTARRRGIEGQPVVAFTLDKGGRLMKAGLAKTSGYRLLDQAALEAVQQAAPYPEIPAELNAETFQFKLPISFILK